ncbi:MAG: hypothetical protein AAF907_17270, partial [Planctomycetota bacterium]
MPDSAAAARPGLLAVLVGDGRPLISLAGLGLIACGLFAFFVGLTGQFLPHDLAFLGTDSAAIWAVADSRLAYFMIHDRVSFGGAALGIGMLYLYFAAVPLKRGEGWAWWAVLISFAIGDLGFLLYLWRGYFDLWRGAASVVLQPLLIGGLILCARNCRRLPGLRTVLTENWPHPLRGRHEVGRLLLAATCCCLMLGGGVIALCGMTAVFVPQDLEYLGLTAEELCGWNPRAIPLITHDRAGFGGAVASCGAAMLLAVLHDRPSPALWQTLWVVGGAGFGAGIGVHFPIG